MIFRMWPHTNGWAPFGVILSPKDLNPTLVVHDLHENRQQKTSKQGMITAASSYRQDLLVSILPMTITS